MTLRNVTGLDLSLTSTGLVTLSAGPAGVPQVCAAESLGSHPLRGPDRLADLSFRICQAGRLYDPALWVLEGYAYGQPRGTSRLAELAELGGVVKWWLHVERQRILIVPPSRLKKFACQRGNAAKDEMRLAVFKRWGFEHASHDVVDAYALARLGLGVLGLDEGLTKAQREVAEELKKQLEGSERA